MRVKVLIVVLLFIAVVGNAQELYNLIGANKVTAYTYWEHGDHRTYKCTRTETVFKNGKAKPKKSKLNEYQVRLKVLDTLDGFYTMSLIYSDYLPNINAISITKTTDVEVIYRVDEYGVFDSILNTERLKESVRLYFKEIIRVNSIAIDSSMVNELLKGDNIHTLFMDDLAMFHNLYGLQFEIGKKEAYEFTYATINDFNLKGIGKIELKSINKEKKESVITVSQTPDKKELNKYTDLLFKLLVSTGEEKENGFSEFNYQSKIKQTYYMDLQKGWMNKIKMKNTVKVKGNKGLMEKRIETIYEVK
ncbi:MAG: hypothetical protein N4A35_05165 [Flavobacteriales bacterium]|jgi:hypothetical protein|nr:hypothetical protein [Flavobacteriales bacterium]